MLQKVPFKVWLTDHLSLPKGNRTEVKKPGFPLAQRLGGRGTRPASAVGASADGWVVRTAHTRCHGDRYLFSSVTNLFHEWI
jgi:hypothetical protein